MTSQHSSPLASHLKHEAKKLRRTAPELTHSQALDQAAIQLGFQGWRHFVNTDRSQFKLTLVRGWRNPTTSTYWEESLTISLDRPLREVFPRPSMLRDVIGDCEVDYDTDTVRKPTLYSRSADDIQNHVRHYLNYDARCIMFMAATGLIRSRAWSKPMFDYKKVLGSRQPRAFDHTKVWRDEDGKYVITTEPYLPRLRDEKDELLRVSAQAGYQVAVADWLGMHNPDLTHPSTGTRLVLISHERKGRSLTSILDNVNKLPLIHMPGTWSGTTVQI